MRFSSNPNDIGSKLGPKLVKLISESVAATKLKLLDTEHRARVHSMQTVIDRAGAEIADLYRPIWQEVASEMDIPDYVRDHMEKIMSGRHQWQAIAGTALGYSGAGSSLSTIISNFLAPGVRFAVGKDPQLLPSPETLISLGTKGTMDWADVYTYCHGQGYADFTIGALQDGSYAWPDLSTVLELVRRNVVNEIDAHTYLTRAGIPPQLQDGLLALVDVVQSPADLADMVVRGIMDQDQAAAQALQSGVSNVNFANLVLDTGEPPGLMQLLEGYRRGFIDQAALEKGIRQSRYRDEWIPLLEQLRFEPMSVADAVNATIQNYITPADAAVIAEQNGLAPGAVDTLIKTAGEPLSRTEMSDLVNRGQATEAEFTQAMRESRVKDQYIPFAFALRRKIPAVYEINLALSHGAMDNATAVALLMDYGYDEKTAEILTKSGVSQKLATHTANITTSIVDAYESFLIPRADAEKLIEGMGYSQAEADYVLQGADFRQVAKVVTQATSDIRSRYVGRKITAADASNDLDALGVPSQQRDVLLTMWGIEVSANTRTLTEAQIVKASGLNLITSDDATSRLVALGYNATDAGLLLNGA
jgi:hypothetical protein